MARLKDFMEQLEYELSIVTNNDYADTAAINKNTADIFDKYPELDRTSFIIGFRIANIIDAKFHTSTPPTRDDTMTTPFKTFRISFVHRYDFTTALSMNPQCDDISYSDKVLSFETEEQRDDFKRRLTHKNVHDMEIY